MFKRTIYLTCIFLLFFSAPTSAQSPQITNGMNYLLATQNPDGSWGGDASSVDILPATVSVIETLQVLNQTGTQNYSNAVLWLQNQTLETTDYLSERIHALAVAGTDRDLLLSYLDEIYTGAWGGYLDFEANNLDTALALLSLRKINYSDQNIISYAQGYLVSTQNTDGGFGFYQGDGSNVYMTALVSMTLQQFPQTTSIATAINKATSYLIAHQNADGGFGSSSSTVYETAYAYLALVGATTDNTVLGNAINYLTTTQSPDGSWLQDPYSTALALRALYLSENRPVPPPPPTTGTVTGKVIDASTNQPLGNVSVVSGQLSATTTNTGEFTLSDMPSGSQTITFSLSDYATATNFLDIRNNLATMVLYNYCLGGINVS